MNSRPRAPQPPRLHVVQQGAGGPEAAPGGPILAPVAFGAVALAALALAVAYWAPGAPRSWLGGAAAFFLGILLLLAVGISAFTRFVDSRLGEPSASSPPGRVARGKYLFDLALVFALIGLGAIAATAWLLADARLDLLVRAWLLLLIGGCAIGLVASLVANFLNLIEPREM